MKVTPHNQGLVIVYYGDGKGKTTAALGIALRAVGRGMNVKVLQFIKGDPIINKKEGAVQWTTGEREFVKRFEANGEEGRGLGKFDIEPVGLGFVSIMCDELPFEEHREAAQKALSHARDVVSRGEWQVVILDEILRAIDENLIEEEDVIKFVREKPEKLHLVLTGHTVSQKIIATADLVTEMKKIKHPYDDGILAKVGIDY